MGKRAWLNDAIATDYLPFLARLKDNEEGQEQAEQFNEVIRSAWSARNLSELSQQQSLMDTTRRAIKDHLGEDHFSLDYIKFTRDEYIILNDAKQGRVAERNEQVQFLDAPDAIVNRAIALLDSSEWSEIAAGLSVLTGRRSSEILSTAQFELCSKWSVTFTGALKRRGETQILSFEIPTLAQSERVCRALAKVRQQLPDAVMMDAETVNAKYGSAVIRECDRHFTNLVPNREGKDNLYTHLFRSVYATIATFWFCPSSVNDVEFKAAIQGHYAILDEKDEPRKRSLTASRHYSDYEIADSVIVQYGGKRKGVKLGNDGVHVIDEFREIVEDKTALPRTKKKLSSVRIWREDKVLLDEIFVHLGLDESLNQSQKMGKLLLWVKEHLEAQPKIPLSEIEAIKPSQTIPDISQLQGERISETTVSQMPLTQDAEQDHTVAVSSSNTLDTEATTESSQSSQNVIPNGIEAKLDQVADLMIQLISLQLQAATPSQTTVPPTKTKVRATSEVKPTTIPNEVAAAGANSSDPITQQRSKRNSPIAEAAIASAIDAIIAHNNTTELHDLKWAISINAVKELVSDVTKSQRLVNKAIKERFEEIDQHHAQHQIQPNHNHRHKRKRTINQVITITF